VVFHCKPNPYRIFCLYLFPPRVYQLPVNRVYWYLFGNQFTFRVGLNMILIPPI
jgi:hypothetical protein